MSTQTEITRLQTARNKLRTKGVELGITTGTDKLDAIAEAFESIENKGAVSAQVQEGESYTIPKGYHNGSGTVSGVAGGGNYNLQSKPAVTPTKKQQNITPDSGYYGLSDVTVDPIPDNYQDVTPVTAGAEDVLANKVIVAADGSTVAGTMPNNGAVDKTLDTTTTSYTVPKGYHDGKGSVKVSTEAKTGVVPSKSAQTIKPSTGKVLASVSVDPIPDAYQDVTDVDATAGDVLTGKTIVAADGTKVTGSMANNGAVSKTLDATTGNQSYTVPAGYHSGTGKVQITLEEKSVTPSKSAQPITPTAGKVLSKVSVAAIPAAYQDVTAVDATAANVLDGKTIVTADGTVTEGTMPNNGAMTKSIDGLATTSVAIPAGYTSGGTVSLTNDIETALAAI